MNFNLGRKPAVSMSVATSLPEATIELPVPRIPEMVVAPSMRTSYEDMARNLGFLPADLVTVQILEFCRAQQIETYDYEEVEAWLSAKKTQVKATKWCWRPLRPQDVIEDYTWGIHSEPADGYYSCRMDECRPYQRVVPIEALEKALLFERSFGKQVIFFVSDYASPRPDPFLMVRPAGRTDRFIPSSCIVVAHWDEPGFQDKKLS